MRPDETENNTDGKDRKSGAADCFTFVPGSVSQREHSPYHDTPIDFSGKEKEIPERIRQMQLLSRGESNLYDFSLRKAKVFYVQGKFMENYEDDCPWNGEICYYYSTYRDLNVKQLRGYFTWRGKVRKGEYERNAEAFAYIYIYELLNGIGVSSPEESVEKMSEFEKCYADRVVNDPVMRRNIRRWIFALAVLNGMDKETVMQYLDPENLKKDKAIAVLKEPEKYDNHRIFEAMCVLAGGKYPASPVIRKFGVDGERLFAGLWKSCCNQRFPNGRKLFSFCFGNYMKRPWFPFFDAVYYPKETSESAAFELGEFHILTSSDGEWFEICYPKIYSKVKRFADFMHAADRLLRIYLNAGRPLKEKYGEEWAEQFVNSFIEADRKAREEAKKVKISIDFSDLDRIRKNAVETCDSLLTEEEKADFTQEEIPPETHDLPAIRLDETQIEILRALLDGKSAAGIIAAKHGMPEICADAINEAFFEEIGDNVVECDGKDIVLVVDYREDVERFLEFMQQH